MFHTRWYAARRWAGDRWRAAAYNVLFALVTAQLIEPVIDSAYHEHRLVYVLEPARWVVFLQCVGVALPGLLGDGRGGRGAGGAPRSRRVAAGTRPGQGPGEGHRDDKKEGLGTHGQAPGENATRQGEAPEGEPGSPAGRSRRA